MSQILIGQTAGFSGVSAAGVKEITEGARLWIDAVNARGGVHGQKIELISLDDRFDPGVAAANAKELVEQKNVLALFLNRGTPHSEAILPLLELHGVPLVAPSTGAMVLHQPVRKYVFNVRAPYQREAEKAVTHLRGLGITRIAVVYADDSYGLDGLEGASKGFYRAGFAPAVAVKADRLRPDCKAIVESLEKAGAQAVVWIASGTAIVEGIRTLRAVLPGLPVVTLSNNASAGFVKGLGQAGPGVMVTQVFPSERAMGYAIVREAAALAKEKKIELSPSNLEGFAAAKVLVEGLRRAGPGPTRAKLQAALESLQKFDLGGLEISYGPDDHTGIEFSDLSIIGSDGKFRR
ncbi:MAG TPA: ABC transporter substrate-binding protein [Ramlibacter sp.]|uniref:ABC transporter substrate-binding protein n=1 Tax=Ramlibacter sp. TaxID=1917967 RepID=UPI002D7E228B|nr:ABC transporter substrate-binding protein [Ramlibacter sp.]HET8747525.1 ABC transporter substrate-binding protein [Ramlibacter sp.]